MSTNVHTINPKLQCYCLGRTGKQNSLEAAVECQKGGTDVIMTRGIHCSSLA